MADTTRDELASPSRVRTSADYMRLDGSRLLSGIPFIPNQEGRRPFTIPCVEIVTPDYLREWYQAEDGYPLHRMVIPALRELPDGTWYCGKCDKRFDTPSLHVEQHDVPTRDEPRWDLALLQTTDAAEWAREFVSHHGGDEGLMISWFASAIETGRMAGRDG